MQATIKYWYVRSTCIISIAQGLRFHFEQQVAHHSLPKSQVPRAGESRRNSVGTPSPQVARTHRYSCTHHFLRRLGHCFGLGRHEDQFFGVYGHEIIDSAKYWYLCPSRYFIVYGTYCSISGGYVTLIN